MYGAPGRKPPMWLHGIMKNEMAFFHKMMHGKPADDEVAPLLKGRAARDAIDTAHAAGKITAETVVLNCKYRFLVVHHGRQPVGNSRDKGGQ